jgi:hypothetical protein
VLRIDLEAGLLERLLDPADPALRARVLVDLHDRPEDDAEVEAARVRIPEQPWVKATLAAHRGDGTWGRGFYTKYDGTSWVLLHLSEVGAPMDLAPTRRRSSRSTSGPAISAPTPRGSTPKKRSSANAWASRVSWYIHTLSPKRVNPEPVKDATRPPQITQ